MFKLLYETKYKTKHAISVFQIDDQTVIIKTKSNVLTCLLSLSVWNDIINNPDFKKIQLHTSIHMIDGMALEIHFKTDKFIRLEQFVIRSLNLYLFNYFYTIYIIQVVYK